MTDKPFQLRVFGKPGCSKCPVLNQRIDKLLAEEEWSDFVKLYCDVETETGIIMLCEAECINPQRIPAVLVMRRVGDTDAFEPVSAEVPGFRDPVCRASRLYQHLGLQTDYSAEGNGVITPKMITTILQETRRAQGRVQPVPAGE